jgi:hypothetical protein
MTDNDARGMVVDYTPDQFARAMELWRQLFDHYLTRASTDQYGSAIEKIDECHLAALVASDGAVTDQFDAVTLTLASYSDYHGASYDAANVTTLGEGPGVNVSHRHWHNGGTSAWIQFGELPNGAEDGATAGIEWLTDLAESVDSMADYPVLDDEAHSQYESELQDEAWDAWLRYDLTSELTSALPGDLDWEDAPLAAEYASDPRDRDDIIRDAYYSFEDNEWVCETATSATNYRHTYARQYILTTVYDHDAIVQRVYGL